jgi:two-component system CheB/CheR fusion protein
MIEAPDPREFDALLDLLRQSRGFDFGAYKRASLMRRIQKRMHMVGIESFASYRDWLELHPEEFTLLFNTIVINVTSFFRDPQAWEYFAAEAIQPLIESHEPGEPIRVWSAGCASGEEAYTLAMLLAEAVGPEVYQERVKIYATDADDEALAQARRAIYGREAVENVPEPLRTKYFEPSGASFLFNGELRRSVIFGRHDLVQDAPISRVDLLVCRNTLMYFNAEAQAKILARFHFALNPGGILFLGKAETLLMRSNAFATLDLKRRIFTKVHRTGVRDRLFMLNAAPEGQTSRPVEDRVSNAAFDNTPLAHIVVDAAGALVQANKQARVVFGLSMRDLGRPIQDLEISYRPVELRSCIQRACEERRNVILKNVEWRVGTADPIVLDVQVAPLGDPIAGSLGVSVTFADTTSASQLEAQLVRSNQDLETTLEELQSANEELETTNEELQSTNEELETTNEELQSANEELIAINDEARVRSVEVHHLNAFLESVLANLNSGVVAVDRDMHVQIWNERSAELWGLRGEEVRGRNFLNLDIGLPLDPLRRSIRDCLDGDSATRRVTLDAINRRGRTIRLVITCSRLAGSASGDGAGVILVMDESPDGVAASGDGARSDGARSDGVQSDGVRGDGVRGDGAGERTRTP